MDSLRNHFLVSMPHLTDGFFEKTVIYICDHDGQGSMGLVINRPLPSADAAVILQALGIGPAKGEEGIRDIYYGGPVQPNVGFVLHTPEYETDGTIPIAKDVSLTTNSEIMQDIQDGKGPARYRFTMGYAGWGPEQLDREIANGDWLVVPASGDFIFGEADHSKWAEAARQFGIEISQFSGFGGSA
ncbi:MAG: YqgE/AlgH family protein [Fidelibacterota bacterium]|nr:MAG: YqgE/AlgH family protein [Candidatus Neomarinimicrobiota bacterium]